MGVAVFAFGNPISAEYLSRCGCVAAIAGWLYSRALSGLPVVRSFEFEERHALTDKYASAYRLDASQPVGMGQRKQAT